MIAVYLFAAVAAATLAKLALVLLLAQLEPWTRTFLRRTLEHKYWVLVAGLRTGAPLWRLLTHDWSKFLPSEAPHYGRQYYGPRDRRDAYEVAWHHHQRRNPHHWQYWQRRDSDVGLQMPHAVAREMVADWMAATRVASGRWPSAGDWPWMEAHWDEIAPQLHPSTRAFVIGLMRELFPLTREQLAALREVGR